MAKKVDELAAHMFTNGIVGKAGSNTRIELSPLGAVIVLKLHGNAIARADLGADGKPVMSTLEVCDGRWQTATTKARLNALPGVSVHQKAFQWHLNGQEWDGAWELVHKSARVAA